MLNLQYTEYFYLLFSIPVLLFLYYYLIAWKKKSIAKIGDPNLVNELINNHSAYKFHVKFILIIVAFIASVFALVNMRSPNGSEKITRKGVDVMIALDVSKSMLAQDIKPSRLDRAKQVLNKLVDKLINDRIGLVVFAGRAYLQMPLTSDIESAKMFIESVSPETVPTQGTVIADALQLCATSFNNKEKKYKAIILLSDGEDHDENANKIAEKLADEGIVIHTIGIGSPEGSTIFDPTINEEKKDDNGNLVISKLNEAALKEIAEKANGIYQLFSTTDKVVDKLKIQLDRMEQKRFSDKTSITYKSYFQIFLIISLLFLIIELLIGEKKKLPSIKMKKATLVILLIIPSSLIFAQGEKMLIKKGNDAYFKKEFDKAEKNYQSSIQKNNKDSIAPYNLGNTLYKNKKNQEALQAYDNALKNVENPLDKSKIYYNKGVVLQNDNKLEDCIDAYKKALRLNPTDDDARQNLQKALQKKQQQEQKKQEENKQKNKPKEENDQKEKQKPKDEPQKNNDAPQPNPSKLSQQEAEEKLKALLQQEKILQDKLRKINAGSSTTTNDW